MKKQSPLVGGEAEGEKEKGNKEIAMHGQSMISMIIKPRNLFNKGFVSHGERFICNALDSRLIALRG